MLPTVRNEKLGTLTSTKLKRQFFKFGILITQIQTWYASSLGLFIKHWAKTKILVWLNSVVQHRDCVLAHNAVSLALCGPDVQMLLLRNTYSWLTRESGPLTSTHPLQIRTTSISLKLPSLQPPQ